MISSASGRITGDAMKAACKGELNEIAANKATQRMFTGSGPNS
jgi:hypothetical protein